MLEEEKKRVCEMCALHTHTDAEGEKNLVGFFLIPFFFFRK